MKKIYLIVAICFITNMNTFAQTPCTISLTSGAGTDVQSVCKNSPITDITYQVSGTNATVSSLPSGVNGTFAAGVFTISGSPFIEGTFNYTLTTTGGCAPDSSATGTITVGLGLLTPGTDNQSVCKNTAITDITYNITGGDVPAPSITGLPAGVVGSISSPGVYTISGTPTVEGTFNYTITTSGSCSSQSSATGSITVGLGLITAGTDNQTLCVNTAITTIDYTITDGATPNVTGLPGGVVGSSTGPGVFTISGTPNMEGTFMYTVTTIGSCSTQSQLTGTITVNGIPVTTVSNTTICSGTAGTLTAGGGATTFAWSSGTPSGTGNRNLTDSPLNTTSYIVVGTTSGCSSSATGIITVNANPAISVNNATICAGNFATLTASGATTYSWSDGSNRNPLTVNPTTTTSYTVTGTSSGCSSSAVGTITANAIPVVTVNDPVICIGNSTNLTAVGATTYVWSNGVNTSSINVSPSATTSYTVTGTSLGCSSSDVSTVTITPKPVITVNSPTICVGQAVTLFASGGSTYDWSTGDTGNSITVSPATTVSYTVGDNSPGCSGGTVATVTIVTVAKEPVLMPGGTDFQTICINNPILEIYYDVLPGYTVIGLPPGVSFSNTGYNSLKISGTPTVAGVYTYTLVPQSSACNLSTTHTGSITVKPLSNSSTNPGGCDGFIKISGNVYRDNNSNCTKDAGDQGIDNIHVKLYNANNTLLAHTYTSLGAYDFSIWDSAGIYIVELDVDGQALSTQCPSPGLTSTVTITSGNPQATNVNFNLQCNAEYGIQSVFTSGRVFPGQQHRLNIFAGDMNDWFNLSCPATSSGTLQVTVNGPVTYNNSATGALIPTVQGNTFTYTINNWSTVNMQQDFALLFTTHTTAQANDTVCVSVVLTTSGSDVDPSNNTYHFCYLVRNSYDPNLKEVFPVDVAPGFADWLTYTIHFQNTGNDSAINIRLKDTLDAQLNLETFQVLSYSHANIISIYDNLLTVYYPNIQLPDSISDPQGSQGFVQYRLKPKTNLTVGNQIKNTANIYFDYNAPIRTNTTINECKAGIISITEIDKNVTLSVYPNPNNGVFTVKSATEGNYSIINELGQTIQQLKLNNSNQYAVNIENLNNGIYFIVGDSIHQKIVVIE